jgi:hypothetical protein
MGISQHVHGTDNARCLIALALMCGQVGRSGTGLHPLRGQNNVQGASDAGLIPMFYPDYADVASSEVHKQFEELWKTPLSPERGLTVVEIINAAYDGKIKGMYIQGENPAMSDPDLDHAVSFQHAPGLGRHGAQDASASDVAARTASTLHARLPGRFESGVREFPRRSRRQCGDGRAIRPSDRPDGGEQEGAGTRHRCPFEQRR